MHHTPPLVSVIIPVFNRHKLVQRAVETALSQSTKLPTATDRDQLFELEIFVIDDGSHPPIPTFQDSRVQIIRHDHNCGAGAARNTGVNSANGTYIAFLDSDDLWTPNKLAAQVQALSHSEEKVFGVFCPFKKEEHVHKIFAPRKTKKNWFEYFLGGCRVAPGSTLMFRKSLWESIGPQSSALNRFEDWDWLLRASKIYDFDFINAEYAILGRSQRPRFEVVRQSLGTLEDTWRPKLNGDQLTRLSSAIAIERSAHARANGQLVEFSKNFLKAIWQSPATVAENLSWRYWR